MSAQKATKKTVEVKTLDQLQVELATKQNDLLEAKRGNAAGELTNPRILSVLRKDIARLHMAIAVNVREAAEESK